MRTAAAVVGVLSILVGGVSGETIWVDVTNTSGVEDGSPAHPYNTVQEGVDAAGDGDEVIVLPGEYVENVTMEGSATTTGFTLRAADETETAVTRPTVIRSAGAGSVLTLSGLEDGTCLLAGFTITGGATAGPGGGILGNGSSMAVRDCVLAGNQAQWGGGAHDCDGEIANCTFVRNRAMDEGGALHSCDGVITSCIMWQSAAPAGVHLYACSTPSYSCIGGWSGGGVGNVNADPQFVPGAYSDYYISQTASGQGCQSPCVGAGDPSIPPSGSSATYGFADTGFVDMGAHFPVRDLTGYVHPGWWLFAPSGDWPTGDPEVILSEAVAAGNMLMAHLFLFHNEVKYYEMYPLHFTTIWSGLGYWLLITEPFLRSEAPGDFSSPFSISLWENWNLFGHGFKQPVALADCTLNDGVEVKSWDDAVAAGWVDPTVYFYEGGRYRFVRSDGTGDDDHLRAWHGYWVLVHSWTLALTVPAP